MPLTLRYSSCGMFLFSVACNVLFFAVCLPLKHLFTNDEGVFCFVLFFSFFLFALGETLLSPLVMCGPHGTEFLKPVELRLPHCASMTPDGWSFALKSSDTPTGE